MNIKKSDLKTGMRVKTRDGCIYIVIKDCDTRTHGHQDILLCSETSYIGGDDYNEDMKCKGSSSFLDIVKVYQSKPNTHYCDGSTLNFSEPFYCIWERDDAKMGLQKELDRIKVHQVRIANKIAILEDKLR